MPGDHTHDWQLDHGDPRWRHYRCACGETLTVDKRAGLHDWQRPSGIANPETAPKQP